MYRNIPKNVSIQHEHYKTKQKRFAKFYNTAFMVVLVFAIFFVITLAEGKPFAFASNAQPVKETIPLLEGASQDTIIKRYYTTVTGNEKIAELAITYSAQNDVPASLLIALMRIESNFNPNAINYNTNKSIDRGLCQLNSNTFPHLKTKQFFDPETNIKHAAEILKWCIDTSENDLVFALAYYNAGYGNVSNEKMGEITLDYIHKILNYKKIYEDDIAYLIKQNQS